MALDARSCGTEVNKWRHLLAAAFCVAAAIGGLVVYPSYPRFQAQTDTAGEAFGAFLTCCVVAGGIGPLVTLCLFRSFRALRPCAKIAIALIILTSVNVKS
jgi:hypothetical protein